MEKIAIPTKNEILDSHFGHCDQFYIFEIDNKEIINVSHLTPPPHQPGLLPMWLKEKEVTDVIAGGMGQRAKNMLKKNNINVFVGAPQAPPRQIVESHLCGTLTLKENKCDH